MDLARLRISVSPAPGVDIGAADLTDDAVKRGIIAVRDHRGDESGHGAEAELSVRDSLISRAHGKKLDHARRVHWPVIKAERFAGLHVLHIDRPCTGEAADRPADAGPQRSNAGRLLRNQNAVSIKIGIIQPAVLNKISIAVKSVFLPVDELDSGKHMSVIFRVVTDLSRAFRVPSLFKKNAIASEKIVLLFDLAAAPDITGVFAEIILFAVNGIPARDAVSVFFGIVAGTFPALDKTGTHMPLLIKAVILFADLNSACCGISHLTEIIRIAVDRLPGLLYLFPVDIAVDLPVFFNEFQISAAVQSF